LEQIGGLSDRTVVKISINPALTEDSVVALRAVPEPGSDFTVPSVVHLPAGETTAATAVRSTGPDYTTDGDKSAVLSLAVPPHVSCPPYTITPNIGSNGLLVVIDSSEPMPDDCDSNVHFSVDRQYFRMAEGETVDYRVYMTGPAPRQESFPIIVKWQIIAPQGHKVTLTNPNPRTVAGTYTGIKEISFASVLDLFNGRTLQLTITDPDDNIDGEGKVMVAHHVVTNKYSDPRYTSAYCLQGPASAMRTQMLV
jgi:hypothetical protein